MKVGSKVQHKKLSGSLGEILANVGGVTVAWSTGPLAGETSVEAYGALKPVKVAA